MTWEELEEIYGISFKLESGEWRPVNEWLDDVYLRLDPKTLQNLLILIMNNGDTLFQDLVKHKK